MFNLYIFDDTFMFAFRIGSKFKLDYEFIAFALRDRPTTVGDVAENPIEKYIYVCGAVWLCVCVAVCVYA